MKSAIKIPRVNGSAQSVSTYQGSSSGAVMQAGLALRS